MQSNVNYRFRRTCTKSKVGIPLTNSTVLTETWRDANIQLLEYFVPAGILPNNDKCCVLRLRRQIRKHAIPRKQCVLRQRRYGCEIHFVSAIVELLHQYVTNQNTEFFALSCNVFTWHWRREKLHIRHQAQIKRKGTHTQVVMVTTKTLQLQNTGLKTSIQEKHMIFQWSH